MKQEKNNIIYVRRMEQEDILTVAHLEQECFCVPWSKAALTESYKQDIYSFFVAVIEEKVIGYGGIYYTCDEGNITNVAVREQWRTRGVATMLLENIFENAAKRKCKEIYLEVRASNKKAISLYEKMDFVVLGRRKNFYDKPTEDALVLCKKLPL